MDVQALSTPSGDAAPTRVRVAIDAMGGDHGPEEIVRGAMSWAVDHPQVDLLLVGDEQQIRPHLDGDLPSHVRLVQAAESVAMEEQPAAAVRRKRDASINVAMRLVRSGEADAVVTAGHTGAGVASAILHLGRLRGVDRPALAVQMVTDRGPFVFLDIGATTDSTGMNLAQYARMGAIYSEGVLGVKDPSVALLSIGEEGGKGEARVQEATALLADTDLRFIGNVEGKDLPHHPADVVVCDASVGNVTIKFFEGVSSFIFDMFREEFRRWPMGPVGYLFMRPGLRRLRARFDYERLGGAPLLGVNGTVLITHGRARRRMIGFAVAAGAAAASARVPERIAAALAPAGSATDATGVSPRAAPLDAGAGAERSSP
ncbi:MAG: phosphate acyltransferase PlsX [Chloroflexi bacterium]|nr:phosphate acyltransferase PlsX [Chloroflexota bacterium]